MFFFLPISWMIMQSLKFYTPLWVYFPVLLLHISMMSCEFNKKSDFHRPGKKFNKLCGFWFIICLLIWLMSRKTSLQEYVLKNKKYWNLSYPIYLLEFYDTVSWVTVILHHLLRVQTLWGSFIRTGQFHQEQRHQEQ